MIYRHGFSNALHSSRRLVVLGRPLLNVPARRLILTPADSRVKNDTTITTLSNTIRTLMRSTAHPLTIITTNVAEPPSKNSSSSSSSSTRGLLVSSFNTITLHPKPYISFNMKLPSRTHDAIRQSGTFIASGISNDTTANAFVQPGGLDMRWDRMIGRDGLLQAGLGGTWWMRCEISSKRSVEVGDHVVLVAEVVEAGAYGGWEGQPGLIYAEGKYRRVGDIVDSKSARMDDD